ncbi:TBC1 domain family member 2B-like, partial [Saccoglossus kowalevskii]
MTETVIQGTEMIGPVIEQEAEENLVIGEPAHVQPEPAESQSVDIYINNVVCCFSTRCHLDLRRIGMEGINVEYRRDAGKVTMRIRKPYSTSTIWSSGKITCAGATRTSDLPPILSPVDIPDDTIGQKSANSPHHSAVFNFSLTNWKTELRNQFRSKVSGHQDTATPPRPQSQFYDIDELEDLVVLEEEKNKLKTQREGIASTIKKKLSLPRPLNDPEPSQIQLSLLREELDDVETEMKACKEVITLLHNQLAATQLEKASCDDYLKCKSDKERVSLLQRKDKQLIQLQQILDEFRSERDNLQEQIRYCKTEIVSLKEQCTMYTDMLQAKDEIIVSLTNQIFDLDKNAGEEGRSSGHIPMNSSTNTVVKTVENAQELEKLK